MATGHLSSGLWWKDTGGQLPAVSLDVSEPSPGSGLRAKPAPQCSSPEPEPQAALTRRPQRARGPAEQDNAMHLSGQLRQGRLAWFF